MAIKLKDNNGNVDLTTNMLKGDAGGYYTPNVDEEGNLTWIASEEGMAAVDGANIRGPQGIQGIQGEPGQDGEQGIQGEKGEPGENNVYVGEDEPTNPEILVWINPDGEESGELATKDYVDEAIKSIPGTDLTGYATEDYVNTTIDALEIPSIEGLATETYVDEAIAAIPKTDLTEYATETYVTDTVAASLENYYNKTQIDEKGFQNETQVKSLINAALEEVENGAY